MSINTQLSDLQSNLQTAKDSFATILTNKGITTVNQYSPLQDMIDSVDTIQSGNTLDFESLGLTEVQQTFENYYNSAKPIYDTWDPSQTDLTAKYKSNMAISCMPLVDTTNATNMSEMFYLCKNLEIVPLLNTINVTNMSWMFYANVKLRVIPAFNTSKVTNFDRMISGCASLTKVTQLDFSSVITMAYFATVSPTIVFMLIKNIGKSSCLTYDFSGVISWGVGTGDNKQSLIDSLSTYSYNRAANSMSTATIKISTSTKASLTASQIAPITAKGFTIATA